MAFTLSCLFFFFFASDTMWIRESAGFVGEFADRCRGSVPSEEEDELWVDAFASLTLLLPCVRRGA